MSARIAMLANESEQGLYDAAWAALMVLASRLYERKRGGKPSAYYDVNRALNDLCDAIDRDTELLP